MKYEPILSTAWEVGKAVWSESQNTNIRKKVLKSVVCGEIIKHLVSAGAILSNLVATGHMCYWALEMLVVHIEICFTRKMYTEF